VPDSNWSRYCFRPITVYLVKAKYDPSRVSLAAWFSICLNIAATSLSSSLLLARTSVASSPHSCQDNARCGGHSLASHSTALNCFKLLFGEQAGKFRYPSWAKSVVITLKHFQQLELCIGLDFWPDLFQSTWIYVHVCPLQVSARFYIDEIQLDWESRNRKLNLLRSLARLSRTCSRSGSWRTKAKNRTWTTS